MGDPILTDPAGPVAMKAARAGLLSGFLAIFATGFLQVGIGRLLREQAQELAFAGWRFLDSRDSLHAIVLIGAGLLFHRDPQGVLFLGLLNAALGYLLAGAGCLIEAQRRVRPLMVAFVLGLVPLAANLIFNATAPALRPTPWSWEVDDSARSIIFWLSSALGLVVIAALIRWRADDSLPRPEETPVVDSTEVF